MSGELIKKLVLLGAIAIIVCLVLMILAIIGAVRLGSGCIHRYNFDENGNSADYISTTVNLKANGNYSAITTVGPSGNTIIDTDPTKYGKWLNTNIIAMPSHSVKFKIKGNVSLCKAYLPLNNLQSNTNLDSSNKKIEIPRVEDNNLPLSIYFDAKTDEWRNLVQLANNDKTLITVSSDKKSTPTSSSNNIFLKNVFNNSLITADCSDGKREYSPICGRYSIYKGKKLAGCKWNPHCYYVGNCKGASGSYEQVLCKYAYNSWIFTILKGETPPFSQEAVLTWVIDSVKAGEAHISMTYNPPPLSTIFHTHLGPKPQTGMSLFNVQHGCMENITNGPVGLIPSPYESGGRFNIPWSNDITKLTGNSSQPNKQPIINNNNDFYDPSIVGINPPPPPLSPQPPKDMENCNLGPPDYANNDAVINSAANDNGKSQYWFSANDVAGLLYRLDVNENPVNKKQRGGNYQFAKIVPSDQFSDTSDGAHVIYDGVYKITGSGDDLLNITGTETKFLQYRFIANDGQFANNTGGYVFNIKQTKCRRSDGSVISDKFANRGRVEYLVVPSGLDPNDPGAVYTTQAVSLDSNGVGTINAAGGVGGNVWMRIANDPADYKDSAGQYTLHFITSKPAGDFTKKILTPLFEMLKGKIKRAGVDMFKNMTCYRPQGSTASCTNFFNYIRALLILYVVVQAGMFLIGMIEVNQMSLFITVVKVALIGGLLNENTFNFFNTYLIDSMLGFSDAIISNISGYNRFTSTNSVTNPFMFMDALMSKIFFSEIFVAQLMALMALGLSGFLYFLIVFIALMVMLLAAFRAIAVYIMAFIAITLLIGIAPLFLTFILFDSSRYLFDNWLRFIMRYMLEPVILMAGIIILTQLFTIYLDYVLGYSVCWKCAVTFKMPIQYILEAVLTNVELFCINWFAPWGLDHSSGSLGVNLPHIASLMIIAYCIYGYTEFSGQMVSKLTGGLGVSATGMGKAMSGALEQKALGAVGLDKQSRKMIKASAKKSFSGKGKGEEGAGAGEDGGESEASSSENSDDNDKK